MEQKGSGPRNCPWCSGGIARLIGPPSDIPLEEEYLTVRELNFDADQNETLMLKNLDMLDETRARAQTNI